MDVAEITRDEKDLSWAIKEITLWIDSEEDLYFMQMNTERFLAGELLRGKYDRSRAVLEWFDVCEVATLFRRSKVTTQEMLSRRAIKEAAVFLATRFESELERMTQEQRNRLSERPEKKSVLGSAFLACRDRGVAFEPVM